MDSFAVNLKTAREKKLSVHGGQSIYSDHDIQVHKLMLCDFS